MLPFWLSVGVLSIVQGAVVALPRALRLAPLERLRRSWWGLVPPLSVLAFVLVGQEAVHASAHALTYLALVCVPPLAALALGWLVHGARPWLALLVAVAFGLAWGFKGSLGGEAAALALSAWSCAALGALLAAVTPALWLGVGVVAMALADTAVVVSDLLARPNNALNAAHPAAGLPRLQSAVFGSAVMGYGDLFIAGVLGALLVAALSRTDQLRGAAATACLALLFDLLFFAVRELPATVPVAVALLVTLALRRPAVPPRSTRSRARAGRSAPRRAPAGR
jgi:hypothetical protein